MLDDITRDWSKVTAVEARNDCVFLSYLNPDGNDGDGQLIEICITQSDYAEAQQHTNDESEFIDFLLSRCRTTVDNSVNNTSANNYFANLQNVRFVVDYSEVIRELQAAFSPKQRLFIDMDGTLARFHDEVQYLERMFEKDFFKNLKPFREACEAVSELVKSDKYEVYILSAAVDGEPPYCRAEKSVWICNNIPEIDIHHHAIFTKVGQPKASFIPGGIRSTDILLDDYTKNLLEWERDGGIGIKAKNNINCKGLYGEAWNGAVVDITTSPEQISLELDKLAQSLPGEYSQELSPDEGHSR